MITCNHFLYICTSVHVYLRKIAVKKLSHCKRMYECTIYECTAHECVHSCANIFYATQQMLRLRLFRLLYYLKL